MQHNTTAAKLCGEKRRSAKIKMLNDIHTAFCQEVCRGWPTVPSGTTTLDPLMLALRQVLWNKKSQELKNGRKLRAETKVHDAAKGHKAIMQTVGLMSEKVQEAATYLEDAVKEMETISAEALPEFDPEWFPTLWRAYLAFGPSLENPHGHGGFLSPRNGACMTSGPMADVDQGNAPSKSSGIVNSCMN